MISLETFNWLYSQPNHRFVDGYYMAVAKASIEYAKVGEFYKPYNIVYKVQLQDLNGNILYESNVNSC